MSKLVGEVAGVRVSTARYPEGLHVEVRCEFPVLTAADCATLASILLRAAAEVQRDNDGPKGTGSGGP